MAIAAVLRGRRAVGRERIELTFEDGSSVVFPSSSPQAERMLPLARLLLASARA